MRTSRRLEGKATSAHSFLPVPLSSRSVSALSPQGSDKGEALFSPFPRPFRIQLRPSRFGGRVVLALPSRASRASRSFGQIEARPSVGSHLFIVPASLVQHRPTSSLFFRKSLQFSGRSRRL